MPIGPGREIINSPVIDGEDVALGLNLPFNTSDGSLFELTFLSIDQAVANVKNLLLTRKGERVNHPQFGTNLQDYLFEPNYQVLRDAVGTEIKEAVELWLPYIIIKTLDVKIPESGEGDLVDRFHGIFVVLKIGLLNNTIDEEEIVLNIRDL
tara:strand:- start:298 stop:753 length:456 start_codon:yes stop_codon:yes gene_type:complete